MITWDHQTNCLLTWQVPHWPQPLRFTGWGIEVGNAFGFFAQERLGGFGCRIESGHLEPTSATSLGGTWHIKFPKAELQVTTLDELVSPEIIIRHLSVTNRSRHEMAWLGDAVLRLVIPWEEGVTAEVEQRTIVHRGSNFYYDTEEPEVALRWPDGRRLVVGWHKRTNVPPALTPYLYVRDQPTLPRFSYSHCAVPSWVIHGRLLVDYPAALVFRVWRDPLVMWSRGFIGRYLISTRHIRNLWRAGEWHPGTRWNLFGLWPLLPQQSLQFSLKITAGHLDI
jgi:hypothetical protein